MTNRTRAILFAILVAHISLTAWLSAVLNIWVDEAYTLHTTSLSVGQTAHQALVWEVQPPLYFVLVNLWRHLGTGIFFVRLFSVIAVALGAYIASLVARSYLSEGSRLWVTAVVAFNPFIIASGIEARVYGLVFLWSALLMWLFYEGYLREGRTAWARAAFALVAAAALYTQYYTGFLLPAFGSVLLIQRRWRDLTVFVIWMALVAASFIPIALFVRSEIATNATNFETTSGFLSNLIHVTQTLVVDILPVDWAPRIGRLAAYAAAAITLVIIVWRSDKSSLKKMLTSPAAILVTATVLFAATVTAAHMPISGHYIGAFHLPAFILLFALLSAMPGTFGKRLTPIAATVLIILNLISLAYEYRPLAKYGDWVRVNSFISTHESNNQRIVVFDAQSALPLAYYYRGSNPIVPLPQPMRFDRYDLHDVALHNQGEVTRALGYSPGQRAEVWLVTSDGCRRVPVNFHCELLDDFVARNYQTLLDQQFHGTRVRLIRENI
jgi:uncharacterized membrane protein